MNSARPSPPDPIPPDPMSLRTTPATRTKRKWSGSIQDILFPPSFRLRRGTDWNRYRQAVQLTCCLYGVEEHMLTYVDLPVETRNAQGEDWARDEELCKAIIYFNVDETYAGDERYVDDMWELSAADLLETVERVHYGIADDSERRSFWGSWKLTFWEGVFAVVPVVVGVLYVIDSGDLKA